MWVLASLTMKLNNPHNPKLFQKEDLFILGKINKFPSLNNSAKTRERHTLNYLINEYS